VFCLLDHWRQRHAQRLKPLILELSCPLLEDVERTSERSEQSSDFGNNTESMSEDGVGSISENTDDAMSTDGSDYASEGREEEE
jgi:hypothetical protein